jgi:aminoglycoside phosphotransferase (APT) family kinase protein
MSEETVEHLQGYEYARMMVSAPVSALAYAQSERDVLREPRRLVIVLSCGCWQAMRGADQTEPRSHINVHACGSTEDPAERLLTYLRERLQRPAVAYLRPPVQIAGGFDTRIYALQLAHVPPAFSGRLIVRIFRETDGGQHATAEGTLQNALADAGYLVPRVVEVCTDATVLGGAFILMHCLEGQTLLAAMMRPSMLWRAPRLLASAHARLHALDPLPILRAVEGTGVPSALPRIEDVLVRLHEKTQGRGLERLLPGFAWHAAHRPPAVGRVSILHGDFHPGNVLVANGSVTGVIDWSNAGLGDPAADVATTRVLLTMGPLHTPTLVRKPIAAIRRWLAWRYSRAYHRLHPLSDTSIRYYEALRCYTALLHVAQRRLAVRAGTTLARETYAWSAPEQVAKMTRHFEHVTGVTLLLPAR